MLQSSNHTDFDDNYRGVVYLEPSQWKGVVDLRAHNGVAHRPLAVGATVIYDFVGEFLYS